MKKNKILILFLLFATFLSAQDVVFFQEDLIFRIQPGLFFMNGDYYFRNNSDRTVDKLIYYPIPENNQTLCDSTFVLNVTDNKPVELIQNMKSGARFIVQLKPKEILHLHIGYCQEIVCDSVEYILTTTKYWNKPLEQVTYQLISEFPIEKFSYQPDKSERLGDIKVFNWAYQNFMPKKNMVFYLSD